MQRWINGPATGGGDDKIRMANIHLKTNIPSFHHSIIPLSEQIRKSQKTSIYSVGCRNSEMLTSQLINHSTTQRTARWHYDNSIRKGSRKSGAAA